MLNIDFRLSKLTFEGNPWQCRCFDEIYTFVKQRNIIFRSTADQFQGKKPYCVVTPVDFCVKNLTLVKQHRIVEKFESV